MTGFPCGTRTLRYGQCLSKMLFNVQRNNHNNTVVGHYRCNKANADLTILFLFVETESDFQRSQILGQIKYTTSGFKTCGVGVVIKPVVLL